LISATRSIYALQDVVLPGKAPAYGQARDKGIAR
jgi:hypothetical protein